MGKDFNLQNLSSGIGLTERALLTLREKEGYDFIYKEPLTGMLPWVYVFRIWSSTMKRYIFLQNIWDYYEEVFDKCLIYFDSSQDTLNNPQLNEEFMNLFIRGQKQNVGRKEEALIVNGVLYSESDPALLEALRNNRSSERFEATNEFYRLDCGDYLMYDKEASEYGSGLEIVNAFYYETEMLSVFKRRDAWDAELRRRNQIMFSSPKYRR